METEGYIKFKIDHSFEPIEIPKKLFEILSECRTKLYDNQLIGTLPNGIGFGNISHKYNQHFVITGSATGSERILAATGYAIVTKATISKNYIASRGSTKASSESLSHAAIYETNSAIKAVIHIHNKNLWQKLRHKLPTTPDTASYGTPALASAIQKLLSKKSAHGIIIMGGHEDGILTYGSTLEEAATILYNLIEPSLYARGKIIYDRLSK